MTAIQDIQKYEFASIAQGPRPGTPQHASWRGTHRYKPYDHRDSRKVPSNDEQPAQPQLQPWRQFSRNRSVDVAETPTLVFPRPSLVSNLNV